MQFGSKGANDGQLNCPFGVTVHYDKVYAADYDNKRISVFQVDGKFCISFRAGGMSSQLVWPNLTMITMQLNALVADNFMNIEIHFLPLSYTIMF